MAQKGAAATIRATSSVTNARMSPTTPTTADSEARVARHVATSHDRQNGRYSGGAPRSVPRVSTAAQVRNGRAVRAWTRMNVASLWSVNADATVATTPTTTAAADSPHRSDGP
jgi:hypothetical protein